MEIVDRRNQALAAGALEELTSQGGFSFDLYERNSAIMRELAGNKAVGTLPRAMKTGTTIVGIVYKDGVVLGADTRATNGSEVADKNCEKIHYLAPNIYCCGAGTAADTEKTTELIASNLELLRLSTGTQSRVITALPLLTRMLYRYQGHVSAALVLGGVDVHGPHLYSIHPHGSTQKLPYTTMGSGSLAAMAVFESRYAEDMEEADAIKLVRDAICAGIFNDLGSGSNVDVTVIRKGGEVQKLRTYETAGGKAEDYKAKYERPPQLNFPRGTTVVIKESFRPHVHEENSLQFLTDALSTTNITGVASTASSSSSSDVAVPMET
jgi:20S proteasome subunit beta 2